MSYAPEDVELLIETELAPTLQTLGFGLQKTNRSRTRWLLVGEHYQIGLTWDPRGELTFDVSDGGNGERIPLWMMLGQNDPDWALAGSIMLDSSTPAQSGLALQRLAQLLRRNSKVLTHRDDVLLPQLIAQKREAAKDWHNNERFSVAERNANQLWQSKSYEAFISVLSEWENDLSPAMTAKLQYARKRAAA